MILVVALKDVCIIMLAHNVSSRNTVRPQPPHCQETEQCISSRRIHQALGALLRRVVAGTCEKPAIENAPDDAISQAKHVIHHQSVLAVKT
jgi:hypothetical protein